MNVKSVQTSIWQIKGLAKYGRPLHSADLITAVYRFSRVGQTGVKPRGSKVSTKPVLSWKLDQTNCPLVHFNYSWIKRKSSSPRFRAMTPVIGGVREGVADGKLDYSCCTGLDAEKQIPNLITKQRPSDKKHSLQRASIFLFQSLWDFYRAL